MNTEIARLRDLSLEGLRARWRAIFRREAPLHLPRHLLLAMVAYQLQTEVLGGFDSDTVRFLKQIGKAPSKAAVVPLAERFGRQKRQISPGTILTREWSGQHHRVTVLEDGFAWDGRTYKSLSKIAKAITGTKWNGPRFFGLRDNKKAEGAE